MKKRESTFLAVMLHFYLSPDCIKLTNGTKKNKAGKKPKSNRHQYITQPSAAYWTQHLYCSSGPHNLDPTKAHGGKSSARSMKAGDTHNDSNQRDNPLLMSIRPKMPTASATATSIKNIVIQYFVEQAIHFAL
ncbi:hypothetical protein CFP56_006158 [Quercus suber]|uniref:Uncharacterized protein n=1 Tax=Quercus suber TaxID=58331 RepID=A0AAW0L8F3_QUESU